MFVLALLPQLLVAVKTCTSRAVIRCSHIPWCHSSDEVNIL